MTSPWKRACKNALPLVAMSAWVSGCSTLKPYEKEYLLHPAMDDQAISVFGDGSVRDARARVERLSSSVPGSGGSTSCPTCGG